MAIGLFLVMVIGITVIIGEVTKLNRQSSLLRMAIFPWRNIMEEWKRKLKPVRNMPIFNRTQ